MTVRPTPVPGPNHAAILSVRPSMQALSRAVDARPLVPMAIGFAVGDLLAMSDHQVWNVAAFCALLCLALAWAVARWKRPLFRALLLAGLFALLGFWRGGIGAIHGPLDPSHWAADRRHGAGLFVDLTGTVASEPARSGSGWTVVLDARMLAPGNGKAEPVDGRVAVWMPVDSGDTDVHQGDQVTVHGSLERPDPAANPGELDPSTALEARSVTTMLHVRRRSDVRRLKADGGHIIERAAIGARASFLGAMGHAMPGPDRDLLAGIVFGARSQMPARIEDDFARTGTVHVLATAGLHVGIVAAALFWLFRAFWVPRRWSSLLTILSLVVYALATGGRPAITRAVLMASVYLAAYLLDREPDGPTALAAALLWMLGASPARILDVGFQLSFTTMAVLLALRGPASQSRHLLDRGSGRNRGWHTSAATRARDLFMLSLCAQLGAAPLTAQYFHLVSPISLIANLIAVPLVSLILVVSLPLWPVALLLPTVASVLAACTVVPLLSLLVGAVRTLADVPGGSWSAGSPGWLLLALYYGVLFALAAALRYSVGRSRDLAAPATGEAACTGA